MLDIITGEFLFETLLAFAHMEEGTKFQGQSIAIFLIGLEDLSGGLK